MKNKPIYVTKPYLPDISEYKKYLDQIWKNGTLTNNGPLVQEFEAKLKKRLGVKHLFLVSNGTIALQLALKALNITGEVITTPFTYVATTNAILWEGATAVFCDIDPETLMIDPTKIEKLITPRTEAILGVHIYGYPCDVWAIERIARKHNLKVIYDAAHGFGTKIGRRGLMNFGDISTLSFHATKLMHTAEGGAVMTNDDAIARKLYEYRSFGQVGDEYVSFGINAKVSELHAAMGLCNLDKIDALIRRRKNQVRWYNRYLEEAHLVHPKTLPQVYHNYSYYAVLFPSAQVMRKVRHALENENIFPRQYFYPSLNTLPYVHSQSCPVSEDISQRVLCLPLYHDLRAPQIKRISEIIVQGMQRSKYEKRLHADMKHRLPATLGL
ncbi:DegT/DnrJ/EryC1/StrS family aminotransferase [Candidatus Microgenomates bacterium]|nr:MAG: DegT/DnrJ/EryC1/StrS family aminotransferase [Candidatus Microgenomates bacterium]